MASGLGDLWQVTDTQVYLSQQVLNVYYYRVTSVTGILDTGYAAFDTWFQTNVMTPVRAIQNGNLSHTQLSIRNLTNGLDIYDNAIALPGTFVSSTATQLMPFLCHSFRLIRESLATRNGYKRYSGLDEAQILNGVSSLSAAVTNAVVAGLKADWVSGAVTLAEPVIPRRPLATPATTYVYSSIGDAQYRGISTQNTRKVGRGS